MSTLYVVKEGLSGFRRAKLAAIGSIITITISLLLLGLFYVISTNTSRIVDEIREKVEMEAFLEEPLSKARINQIQQQLLTVEGVDRVQFVSKDEAARIFKEEFGEDINRVLDFNPLPPSFKIFLRTEYRTTHKASNVQSAIMAIKDVEKVVYRKDMLEFIEKQTSVLYLAGLALGILLGISAIYLVSNTIRLTIYAKRKSVQTMKLVGASRWFVRAPFLIEGILQGLTGGIIASGIIYYVIAFATGLISTELAEFIRIDNFFYVAVVGVGVILGLFGSSISVRKFIGDTVVT
ncbi:MAG: ABC transporter permease [Ignavibacteria bacterium]|nr:ABC transporter permease [Ignavibacteria bacterium]MBI3765451.1 ABC transporter permease [Ignavibacteriales bacterium]